MRDDSGPETVEEVIGELDELAATSNEVCLADVLDDFGKQSFGPVILILALLMLTPLGAVPGMPTTCALLIALVALQLLLGREHIWMPDFIQRRTVGAKKLHRAVQKLRGIARWLDDHSQKRLDFLTQGIWLRLAAVGIIVLCLAIPPLEIVPFAAVIPIVAISAIALGLIVRDGLMMLFALLFATGAVGAGFYFADDAIEVVEETVDDSAIVQAVEEAAD